MAGLWPLLALVLILLGSGVRLLCLERDLIRLERQRDLVPIDEHGNGSALFASLARLVPRALSRVAHFSGAGLGLVALSRSIAGQESPLVGVGCLGLGSLSALGISAWGRRFEGRSRALHQTGRAEMRERGGKV